MCFCLICTFLYWGEEVGDNKLSPWYDYNITAFWGEEGYEMCVCIYVIQRHIKIWYGSAKPESAPKELFPLISTKKRWNLLNQMTN